MAANESPRARLEMQSEHPGRPIVLGLFGGSPQTWQDRNFFDVLDGKTEGQPETFEWHARFAMGDFYQPPDRPSLLDQYAQELLAIAEGSGRPFVMVASDTPSTMVAVKARQKAANLDFPIIVGVAVGPYVLGELQKLGIDQDGGAVAANPIGVFEEEESSMGDALHHLIALFTPQNNSVFGTLKEDSAGENIFVMVTNFSNPGWFREADATTRWVEHYNFHSDRQKDRLFIRLIVLGVSCAVQSDPAASGAQVTYDVDRLLRNLDEIPNLKGVLVVGDAASSRYRDKILSYLDRRTLGKGTIPSSWETLSAVQREAGLPRGTLCWNPPRDKMWRAAADIAIRILSTDDVNRPFVPAVASSGVLHVLDEVAKRLPFEDLGDGQPVPVLRGCLTTANTPVRPVL
jgi:hypothetical protein